MGGVTSERRLEGLCINFVICCLLSVCNIFTTPTAAYHRPNLERAHKVLAQLVLYCTVLYCTVIYCTVLYCNVRCKYIGNHSRNDYFGLITVIFLEIINRGDRG